ncbi:hypothetical protein ACFWJY_00590 [Streptomyces anulatus]|uniref:hypothetical protein n=1 Tax=Streptomyces anulatus TaxID=1892 RepID=UPI003668A32C
MTSDATQSLPQQPLPDSGPHVQSSGADAAEPDKTTTSEKLKVLDRQARALEKRRVAVTETAVDLVVHHRQRLSPTARRAGLTAWALRKAVYEHPEMLAIFGPSDGGPEQEGAAGPVPGGRKLRG